jgi:hypothetical protein
MLNFDQLQGAVAAAQRRFDLIRRKYPGLKACLVLSLPGGQTGIDSSPAQILSDLPAMVVDDDAKVRALDFQAQIEKLELQAATDLETERLKQQLDRLSSQLKYDEKCQVEIRFKDLKFDLVWKLQVDDLVARDLTPQTRASIQIVLGTLAQFERTHHEQ